VTLRDDPRITAFGLLAETFLGLSHKLEQQLAEHDLKPLEFEVILRLGRSPDASLRMTDLAAQAHITTSGVTRVVDRLEHDGLVRRRACETDRRGSFAQLTEAGQKRLDAILPGHLHLIDHWFTSRLANNQLDALLAGLRIVRNAVNPQATAGIEPPGR
jgi:MarR family transcriptional regulator, 2-MHQ and catechol-resistance regulon repressor